MALLSWSDKYLIGEETIDREHKELFRLINEFHTRWSESRQRTDIARVLNQLVRYAQVHFQHEEAIMEAAKYPRQAEHRLIHVEMFEQIFALHKDFVENELHVIPNTMKFVRNWLVDHIIQQDYAFRDFLARRKPSEETVAE